MIMPATPHRHRPQLMLPGLPGLFQSRTAIHNDTTANAIAAKMMMKAAITDKFYAENHKAYHDHCCEQAFSQACAVCSLFFDVNKCYRDFSPTIPVRSALYATIVASPMERPSPR